MSGFTFVLRVYTLAFCLGRVECLKSMAGQVLGWAVDSRVRDNKELSLWGRTTRTRIGRLGLSITRSP